MTGERIKRNIFIVLKTIMAVLLLGYLFYSGKLTKEILANFLRVDHITPIFLSAFCFLISQIFSAWRLSILLRSIDTHLRFLKSLYLTLVGMFFNNVIPGAIGGDIVKGYCLIKTEENSKGRSSGIIIMDRVVGLSALLLIVCISSLYLLEKYNAALVSYDNELSVLFSILVFLVIFFLAAIFILRKQPVRNRLRAILSTVFRKNPIYYMAEGLAIIIKKPRYLPFAFVISLLIQITSLLGILILGHIATDHLPDIWDLAAVSSIVIFSGIIPITPGNIGWTELIAAFGWSAIGSDAGATVFIYWRLVGILSSLPFGLIYIFSGYNRK